MLLLYTPSTYTDTCTPTTLLQHRREKRCVSNAGGSSKVQKNYCGVGAAVYREHVGVIYPKFFPMFSLFLSSYFVCL